MYCIVVVAFKGIVLVYDVNSRESFENLEYWLEEVRKYATSRSSVKMLVANKVDEVNVSGAKFFSLLLPLF